MVLKHNQLDTPETRLRNRGILKVTWSGDNMLGGLEPNGGIYDYNVVYTTKLNGVEKKYTIAPPNKYVSVNAVEKEREKELLICSDGVNREIKEIISIKGS